MCAHLVSSNLGYVNIESSNLDFAELSFESAESEAEECGFNPKDWINRNFEANAQPDE